MEISVSGGARLPQAGSVIAEAFLRTRTPSTELICRKAELRGGKAELHDCRAELRDVAGSNVADTSCYTSSRGGKVRT